MDYTMIETALVEQAVAEATDIHLRELNELQLALAAGGVGEVTFA